NAILEDLGSPGSLYFIAQTDSEGNLNYSTSGYSYVLNYDIDTLIANGSVVLTGEDVDNAQPVSEENSTTKAVEYKVALSLKSEGTTKFAEATKKAYEAGETIAIYFDGQFVSVPKVSTVITGGQATITGMDNYEEAKELATVIRIGAVPLELTEVRSNVVGAKLGESAIETSLIAAAIGFALIILFMVCVYRIMGLAASIALVLYGALDIVIMSAFGVTLTLPGIAGVILSVGMAVDANVIIFARIREELAKGVSVKTAVKNGFDKALSAILDGNITTLIAAAVLFVMGSGTIKGFASTLAIGIILSMFTALFVTKFILNSLIAMGAKNTGLYGKAKELKTFNFVGKSKVFFAISALLVVGAVGMLIYNSTSGYMLNYNIDFIGGTSSTIELENAVDLEYIDNTVKPIVADALGISTADIRANTVNDTNQIVLKTKTLSQEEREKVLDALEAKLGVDASSVEMENISATVGNEMRKNAIIAVAIATVCMLLYICIRFKEFSFGLGSVLALLHDVFVVLLFYAVLKWSVGTTFIACMLTIVGYSINATIVIFDRIRENMKVMAKGETLADVTNKSITQTMTRSINTSLTTLVTVVILAIMGVSSIKEFAYPLIVGIVCGTYSSVCIAGNLWYVLHSKIEAKKAE
ncbi:MAG: protein translocase subunit SecD, partial [Lachnospiraceae bacterium]|nr:protein translocase subunit SecD [Lachnospiraceae bacterium]